MYEMNFSIPNIIEYFALVLVCSCFVATAEPAIMTLSAEDRGKLSSNKGEQYSSLRYLNAAARFERRAYILNPKLERIFGY